MKKELTSRYIILTLLGFIILWTFVTDAWGYSNFLFKNDFSNIGTYIYGYISRIIWVSPAIFLIIRYNNELKFKKNELFSRPVFNKSLLLTLAILLLYIVIMMIVNHSCFWFNNDIILWLVVIKYIIVGIVEEVVFRGWDIIH